MVPTMIQMLLDHPGFTPERFASMRVLTYGASPMPTMLLERLLATFPDLDIFQGYGMTENCGLLTCLGPEEHRQGGELLRSAGRPVAGSVVSVQDPAGTILPAGEVGEVCARAGNFMREYWNRPQETQAAFAGGWYHTGDAGRLDQRGYLYLVDRVKDMIVTGGENVYSGEVEAVLLEHPAVREAAVFGIPDDEWGEAVAACIVVAPGQVVSADELTSFCRRTLAHYKVPRRIEFSDTALPTNAAGKVLKRLLRERFGAHDPRAVNPSSPQ
jgi:long-chain acyl-CoA synthetase